MSHLNQINHWNKPTHHKKQIKQTFFSCFLNFFFAIAPNASLLSYANQSKKEAQEDGTKNMF